MKRKQVLSVLFVSLFLSFALSFFLVSCASSRGALQAEEYFSLGMAFFDLGRFREAEVWLNRARSSDRTMTASQYNLGRIAFETGRFEEAARHFESVLRQDPDNIMALRAAAYSRIRNGDLEKAEALYVRVLELLPESADGAFNYALVLFALERFEDSEAALQRHPFTLEENASSLLLLARAQKAQGKPESLDAFASWLDLVSGTPSPHGLFDYALALEEADFFARAVEQLDAALSALERDSPTLRRSTVLFEKARIILTLDTGNAEGLTTFNAAISAGFSDIEAVEKLSRDDRVPQTARIEIRSALNALRVKAEQAVEEEVDEEESEEGSD